MSLNNEPCITRHTLTDLNPIELNYYLFMISLDKCHGSCNTFDDSSTKIWVSNKTENVTLKLFNLIAGINEAKN